MTPHTILSPLETRVWSRWYTYAPLYVILAWKTKHGKFPVVGERVPKDVVLCTALHRHSKVANPPKVWKRTPPC